MYSGLNMLQLFNRHTAAILTTTHEWLTIHTRMNGLQRERCVARPRDNTGRNVVQQVRHVSEQYYLGDGTVRVILCK